MPDNGNLPQESIVGELLDPQSETTHTLLDEHIKHLLNAISGLTQCLFIETIKLTCHVKCANICNSSMTDIEVINAFLFGIVSHHAG